MMDEEMKMAHDIFTAMMDEAMRIWTSRPVSSTSMDLAAGMVFSAMNALTETDWDAAVAISKQFRDNLESEGHQHHAAH